MEQNLNVVLALHHPFLLLVGVLGRITDGGSTGGSGGGSGDYPRGGRPGAGTANQGYAGGQGGSDQASYTVGGGGGGASAAGEGFPNGPNPSASIPKGGDGGNGIRTLQANNGAGSIGTPGPSSAGGSWRSKH